MSNKKCYIPQNEEKKFEIKRGSWSYSIDIFMDYSLDIDLLNLYLILKSYFMEELNFMHAIYIIGANFKFDEKNLIFNKINPKKFKRMNFKDFIVWYEETYDNVFEYSQDSEKFGLRLCFFKESLLWKKNEFYPIYPWSDELKIFIDENYSIERDLIKKLRKKIIDLEKKKTQP